jgi:hypothetical protein
MNHRAAPASFKDCLGERILIQLGETLLSAWLGDTKRPTNI